MLTGFLQYVVSIQHHHIRRRPSTVPHMPPQKTSSLYSLVVSLGLYCITFNSINVNTETHIYFHRATQDNLLAGMSFRVALCLPKACTSKQAIDMLLINTTTVGFKFTEEYCRLKNDKPYSPGDYTAM